MAKGVADRYSPLQDRQMSRLPLTRLHPDAGGDLELSLFARVLGDGILRRTPVTTRPAALRDASEHSLRVWRGTMCDWASRNRAAPRKSCGRRRGSSRDR